MAILGDSSAFDMFNKVDLVVLYHSRFRSIKNY